MRKHKRIVLAFLCLLLLSCLTACKDKKSTESTESTELTVENGNASISGDFGEATWK